MYCQYLFSCKKRQLISSPINLLTKATGYARAPNRTPLPEPARRNSFSDRPLSAEASLARTRLPSAKPVQAEAEILPYYNTLAFLSLAFTAHTL